MMPGATASAIRTAAQVAADEKCNDNAKTFSKRFLNFPTWYRGFDLEATTDKGDACVLAKSAFENKAVGSIIFTIALNIIDIALRLVGIIAVGFVMWGGFGYIRSRGDPERTKSAIITIRNAIIGMVLAMVATVLVSFVVSRLSA